MKNSYLLLLFCILTGIKLYSQNVLTEDFIFDPADSLEYNGYWGRSGINTEFNVKIVSPGLEYNGYIGSGRGNACLITNDGNGDIVYRNFDSAIVSGSVYMSFMLRVDSLPNTVTQGYPIAFNPNTGGTNLNSRLSIKRETDSTFYVGILKTGGFVTNFSNTIYNIHKTYLLVIKYEIVPGLNNDVSSLYVFESGVPATEPNIALILNQEGDDFTGQASVYINNNYAQDGLKGCNIKIDGIRVGTSWENSVLAVLTSVSNESNSDGLSGKNFPNPFQHGTRINYHLPSRGLVNVTVLNSTGVKCAELINEIQDKGMHEIEWNASNMPAGAYNCIIQFNGNAISNKLLLVD